MSARRSRRSRTRRRRKPDEPEAAPPPQPAAIARSRRTADTPLQPTPQAPQDRARHRRPGSGRPQRAAAGRAGKAREQEERTPAGAGRPDRGHRAAAGGRAPAAAARAIEAVKREREPPSAARRLEEQRLAQLADAPAAAAAGAQTARRRSRRAGNRGEDDGLQRALHRRACNADRARQLEYRRWRRELDALHGAASPRSPAARSSTSSSCNCPYDDQGRESVERAAAQDRRCRTRGFEPVFRAPRSLSPSVTPKRPANDETPALPDPAAAAALPLAGRSAAGPGHRPGRSATSRRCRSPWCRCPTRAATWRPDTDVAAVIRDDLNRSGQFRALPEAGIIEKPDPRQRRSSSRPGACSSRTSSWSAACWTPSGGGYPHRIRTVRRGQAGAPARPGASAAAPSGMRDVAHQIADQIYEKILGVRGAFWTRIAYVTASRRRPRHPVRADGRRLRRLQPADRGAFARAAAVAGLEPGRPQAGLCQLRARQLVDLHAGDRHRRARGRSPASRASTVRRRSRRTAAAWR